MRPLGVVKKAPALASPDLAKALEKLSKAALIDLVCDWATAEVGEDASAEQILGHLQPMVDAVLLLRDDKPVTLSTDPGPRMAITRKGETTMKTKTRIEVGGEYFVKERGNVRTVRVLSFAFGKSPRWFNVEDFCTGRKEQISERRLLYTYSTMPV